ncbi:MAG TPA: hypothetical protein VFE17_06605 [Candidatus Baltobacteraceae bacterium]|nr:hypothetical protein [Candidatus Baltobacteraceae bacterium]
MTTMGTTSGTRQHIIPLISSESAGPLGAIHLPRLWAKLTLAASGMLPEGYDECGPGFDQMTLSDLSLDKEKTIDYVRTSKPTYMQFEQWVIAQNGGSLSEERIRAHNEAVRKYCHNDDLAHQMRTSSGVGDHGISDAVTLNKIEDLDELYRQVVKR